MHTCALDPSTSAANSWQQGRTLLAYYGDEQYEHTLPSGDKFHDFVSDAGKDYWSQVPAPDWHNGTPTRNSPQAGAQTVNFTGSIGTNAFPYEPDKNHQIPAWVGLHPRPIIFGNRRNYFGHGKGTFNNLVDNPENPANYFDVTFSGTDNIPVATNEISLPEGTDIRTSHGTAPDNWYQYDKIHPWMLVDGDCFAKGTSITRIERSGTTDSNFVYKITLSANTINTTPFQGTITFRQGTYISSLSSIGDFDPNSTAFTSHNHGTFDIQMGRGSLNPPATYPLNDISIGSVYPESLEDALNLSLIHISEPTRPY